MPKGRHVDRHHTQQLPAGFSTHAHLWRPLQHEVYVVPVLPSSIQGNDGRVVELDVQPDLPRDLVPLHVVQHLPPVIGAMRAGLGEG